MNKFLITANGFIGDILHASSLCKKLHEQYKNAIVDMFIPLNQPLLLLKQNPYINAIWTRECPPTGEYTLYFNIPLVDQNFPATEYFQKYCGIRNPTKEYQVYTLPEYDGWAEAEIHRLQSEFGKPVVAVQKNWPDKAYQCTIDSLRQGEGAPHRDIAPIVNSLKEHFTLLEVGLAPGIISSDIKANPEEYASAASIIKACDWFVGSEGGLANLACGVKTPTIITTDFLAQNYWKQGRVRKCDRPMMGPSIYDPEVSHSELHPCIPDREIASKIVDIINNKKIERFDWDWDKLISQG